MARKLPQISRLNREQQRKAREIDLNRIAKEQPNLKLKASEGDLEQTTEVERTRQRGPQKITSKVSRKRSEPGY